MVPYSMYLYDLGFLVEINYCQLLDFPFLLKKSIFYIMVNVMVEKKYLSTRVTDIPGSSLV